MLEETRGWVLDAGVTPQLFDPLDAAFNNDNQKLRRFNQKENPEDALRFRLFLAYSCFTESLTDAAAAYSTTGQRLLAEGHDLPAEFLEAYSRHLELDRKYVSELLGTLDWITVHMGENYAKKVEAAKGFYGMYLTSGVYISQEVQKLLKTARPLTEAASPDSLKYPALDWDRIHGTAETPPDMDNEKSALPGKSVLPGLDREFLVSTQKTTSALALQLETVIALAEQTARERGDKAESRRRLLEAHLCRLEALQEEMGLQMRVIAYDLMAGLRDSKRPIPAPLYNIDLHILSNYYFTSDPFPFTDIAYPMSPDSRRHFSAQPEMNPPVEKSGLPPEAVEIISKLYLPLAVENERAYLSGKRFSEIIKELREEGRFPQEDYCF